MAIREPPVFNGGWSDSVARSDTLSWVSGSTGFGRSQPQSAAAVAMTVAAISASVTPLAGASLCRACRRRGAAAASSETVLV